MIHVRCRLYVLIVPVLFVCGCSLSVRPLWAVIERGWIRPATDIDKPFMPVLVRSTDSGFRAELLGNLSPGSSVVISDFNEASINADLNASIGSTASHRYFRVLAQDASVTRVSLEMPTQKDAKLKSWYDIREGHVVPKKWLRYGPGFAFAVLPFSMVCGIATVVLFSRFVRPRAGQ
jgi:hypothetical protein